MIRPLVLILSAISSAALAAPIDCRVKWAPPASYARLPMPEVRYVALPWRELQARYAALGGATAPGYCAVGVVGFADLTASPPIVYYPSDATPRCQYDVIEHERAHVKGWPSDHPGGVAQTGECGK